MDSKKDIGQEIISKLEELSKILDDLIRRARNEEKP
jgi:hypothetical protein